MGKIHVTIDDELEEKIRERTRRKGDLSKFTEEALQAWDLTREFPHFTHINVNDDHATILDRRQPNRTIDVYLYPDKPIYCSLCEIPTCDHIRYTLQLPKVQEAYKKKDLPLPKIRLDE